MNFEFGEREFDRFEAPVTPTAEKIDKIKTQMDVDRIFKERE